MTRKDKQTLEKGFLSLNKAMGEKRAALFISQVLKEGLDYEALKKLSDELEAERLEAAKELEKEAEARRQEAAKKALEFTEDDFGKVMAQYAQFLDERKIRYSNQSGFRVFQEPAGSGNFTIEVIRNYTDGTIRIWAYFGQVKTDGVRLVSSYLKALNSSYPGYDFYEDIYHKHYHEFTVRREFYYTSLEELHEQILALVAICAAGLNLGREKFGSSFGV